MSEPPIVGEFRVNLANPDEVVRLEIAQIADALNCADLTSVRLARVMGLKPTLRVVVSLEWPD